MTDFADDSNISLNAFDEQNADKNALNGKNGMNWNLIYVSNIDFLFLMNRK